MAKVDDIKIEVSIESIFQKEICEVVDKIAKEHGIMIQSVDFDWQDVVGGGSFVIGCETITAFKR